MKLEFEVVAVGQMFAIVPRDERGDRNDHPFCFVTFPTRDAAERAADEERRRTVARDRRKRAAG